ncbi:MAG: PAS domain S-box protein, partial [Chitinophagaceae bacterium]
MEIISPQEHSYFNALLEAFPDAIVIVNAQGIIQHTNSQTEILFGYKKNELAGKAVEVLIPADTHQTHIKHRDNFSKNSHVETIITGSSLEVIKKDGTKFSVEISLSPLKTDEGNFILASIRDASSHKFAEEKLIQLSLAVEQSPASVIITDTKGNIQYANKKFMDVTGYGPEEVMGKNPRILKSDHTSETEYAELWKCIASGQEWQGEFHNKKKNGELYWEKALVSPIFDTKGKIINFLAIKEDISEQKKAEKELTEKEFFLRESQKAGKIGSYKTNFVTGYWQSSETLDNIFGIDENYDRNIAGWLGVIHPYDRPKMEEYLNLEVIGKRKSFNKEYRIQAINDKQTKWLLGLGEVIIDDSGNVTGLIGTIQDITERKNVEELLRQSELNLRTIFDNTNTGFYLLDIDGNIISFNKIVNQFAKLSFGFELQEKKNLIMMISPDRRQQFYDMRREIIRGTNFNYEINYPQLDGAIIWYSVNASQVCDSNGKVIGFCVAVNDITERKKAEDRIRESEETFHRVFNESADPIMLLQDTRFIDCNKSAFSIFGFSSNTDIFNKNPWELSPEKQPDGRLSSEKAKAMIAKALQKGYNQFEWIHIKTSGVEFPVDVMLTPIILNGKQVIYAVLRDITERKQAEEKIFKTNRLYFFVSQLNKMILRTTDEAALFKEACRIAIDFGKYKMAWIGMIDEVTKKVTPVMHAGIEKGYLNFVKNISIKDVPEGRGPTGKAIREDSYILCNDIENDPLMAPWKKEALKHGYRSSLALPIKKFGKVIGAFSIYSDVKDFFNTEEIALLEEVTHEVSFSLENFEKETLRKNSEVNLRESNERYEFVNKATHDTIWEWDYRTNKGKWGEGIISTFGYTKDQQNYAKHWHNEFVHPLDKEGLRNTLENCHREGKDNWQYEYRFRCADDNYKYVYDKGFILYDKQGDPYRMIGAMTDITEKKRLERKLVQQQIKHHKLI